MLSVVCQGDGKIQHTSRLLGPPSSLFPVFPTNHVIFSFALFAMKKIAPGFE
jgi:hypothetical protein